MDFTASDEPTGQVGHLKDSCFKTVTIGYVNREFTVYEPCCPMTRRDRIFGLRDGGTYPRGMDLQDG